MTNREKVVFDYEFPSRVRKRRRRRGGYRVLLMLLLLVFLTGCAAGYGVARLQSRDTIEQDDIKNNGLFFTDVKSNIPDTIDLPDYIIEDLLPINEYSRCGDKLTQVNDIVIHYVGNPNTTAWQNVNYFRNLATSGETSASSNLVVGMDGEVRLCVPLNEVAYCSNERNHDTVSIEFCHPDETGEPTEATYERLVTLTAWLCDLYGLDSENVIRHYDVMGKECPRYFVENEDAWEQFKEDVKAEMKA